MRVPFSSRTQNATSARYDQDHVSVLDLRGGLIRRYRDDWNPLTVLAAADNVNATYDQETGV